jgi:sterol desaturase/sphingolipid hydroxylase (fatty acid hydroxylase superfamily)
MHYLIENYGAVGGSLFFLLIQTLRYLFFAGVLFVPFYILWRNKWWHRNIQQKIPAIQKIKHEVIHSLQSILILLGFGWMIYFLKINGFTLIYTEIEQYGWFYLIFSTFALIFIHDTYFYWTHRLMHHKKLYRWFHKTHHHSQNPTPWASLSFHPLEAMVEFAVAPIMVFIMPLHPLALFIFATLSMSMNVIGHLGFEIFPKGFTKHWFGSWQNTATHHNMHHQLVNCNYGLYFNLWDKWMGTNHKNYLDRFDEVTHRKPSN